MKKIILATGIFLAGMTVTGTVWAYSLNLEELKAAKESEVKIKYDTTMEDTNSWVIAELESYKKQKEEQFHKEIDAHLDEKLKEVSIENKEQAEKYLKQQKEIMDKEFENLTKDLKTYIDNLE